jgi:hypothetical protein
MKSVLNALTTCAAVATAAAEHAQQLAAAHAAGDDADLVKKRS